MKTSGSLFNAALAIVWALAPATLIPPSEARAQSARVSIRALAANVIVPQSLARPPGSREGAVKVADIRADVVMEEQVATTVLEISLENRTGARQEAELVVPVPDGASVRGFTFQGAGAEPTAELLRKDEARKIYDSIVAKMRDPALLEFVGFNLIRSCVFPVEPNGRQRLRLTYEQLLDADGSRVDYVLPRSESIEYDIPWRISVRIETKHRIAAVYSPSHELLVRQKAEGRYTADISEPAGREPGPFRMSYLLEQDGVSASLFAYPGPKAGEGYFLLLAGAPTPARRETRTALKREVTLVLDRSGSMAGEKMEQARQAAIQVVTGLEDGESFNIIVYNEAVESFAERPVVKTRATASEAMDYIKRINARGGTNLHDALLEALRQKPAGESVPIVLFLTDGLPTIGQTSEAAIRRMVSENNPHKRRVFTFGVGVDVNTPLLEAISDDTRARPTFILPKEDVEVKVASVFDRLSGPTLAEPDLDVVDANGEPALGRITEVLPSRLPDLFKGDQIVLLGRYRGDEPFTFRLTGNYLGDRRTFKFAFDLSKATVRHSFVPRLWAARKIAVLVDAIRQAGADSQIRQSLILQKNDPRIKELVDEIVRLSTEFGILTEYTAFLAREGTNLDQREEVLKEAQSRFESRAMKVRSGMGSFNQSVNNDSQRAQTVLNARNAFYDETMNRVAVANVQQVNDMAFYNRNGRWVDSRIVTNENDAAPQRKIEFGSDEFKRLAERLSREGRQGSVAFRSDVLMMVDGERVLVTH